MQNSTCNGDSGPACGQHKHIYFDFPEQLNSFSEHPSFLPIVITHAIVFLFGVIGNTAVIITWAGLKPHRYTTYTFLVNLAIADMLFLLIYAPLETIDYFVITWDKGGPLCKIKYYLEMLTGMASVLNLTAVSFERYLAVAHPSTAVRFCANNSRIGLCIVWGLAICLAIPVSISKQIHPITYYNNVTTVTAYYCWDSTKEVSFQIAVYQLIMMFVAPAILMTCCYTFVIRKLWINSRTVTDSTRSNDTESEEGKYSSLSQTLHSKKQVIKMLILVVVLFHACWGPRLIMKVMLRYGLLNFTNHVYNMRVTAYLLSFVHSAINPIIYISMSSNFRSKVLQCCNDCFCRKINYFKSVDDKKLDCFQKGTLVDSYEFSTLTHRA